jgi:hypothetical protein
MSSRSRITPFSFLVLYSPTSLVSQKILIYSTQQSPSLEANQFTASQEINRIFMEPEVSLPYSQVPATCPCPEPTPSSPHNPFQLPEEPS